MLINSLVPQIMTLPQMERSGRFDSKALDMGVGKMQNQSLSVQNLFVQSL